MRPGTTGAASSPATTWSSSTPSDGGHGRRHQGVVHVEPSRQRQVDDASPPGEPRRPDREPDPGRLVAADGDAPVGVDALEQARAPRVVGEHHGVPAPLRGEQRGLGLEVGVHGPVVVEVVPAQVGEGGDLVLHGVHPVLGDGVGGHLHDDGPAPRRPRTRPGTAGGRAPPGSCACRPGCRSPRSAGRRRPGSTPPAASPWSCRWSRSPRPGRASGPGGPRRRRPPGPWPGGRRRAPPAPG